MSDRPTIYFHQHAPNHHDRALKIAEIVDGLYVTECEYPGKVFDHILGALNIVHTLAVEATEQTMREAAHHAYEDYVEDAPQLKIGTSTPSYRKPTLQHRAETITKHLIPDTYTSGVARKVQEELQSIYEMGRNDGYHEGVEVSPSAPEDSDWDDLIAKAGGDIIDLVSGGKRSVDAQKVQAVLLPLLLTVQGEGFEKGRISTLNAIPKEERYPAQEVFDGLQGTILALIESLCVAIGSLDPDEVAKGVAVIGQLMTLQSSI